jgi:hypothetical protein
MTPVATATILSDYVARVTDAVAKLNARAKRLRAAPYVLTLSEPSMNWRPAKRGESGVDRFDPGLGRTVRMVGEEVVEVTISGEPVKANGWAFVAKLDFLTDDAAGVVVSKAPGYETLVVERPDATRCDHCRVARRRSVCYVVQHDTGARKVVGSSCLTDFTGLGRNVERVVELGFMAATLLDGADEWGEGGGGGRSRALGLPEYLTAVAAVIRAYGWLSRGKAWAGGMMGRSSADLADAWLCADLGKRRENFPEIGPFTTRRDRAEALRAIHWAEQLSGDSDYEENCRAIATAGYYLPKHMGLAASIVSSWQRHRGALLERRRRVQVNPDATAGAKGDKIHAFVEVVRKRYIEGDWGVTTQVVMTEVATGAVVVWWASGSTDDLVEGERVQVQATVKKIDEYKGTKQTVVTRLCVPPHWVAPKKVRKPKAEKTEKTDPESELA